MIEIVYHIGGIEQLGNGGVDVLPSLIHSVLPAASGGLWVVNIVEFEVRSTVRSVVEDIGSLALSAHPVPLGENVVTPGDGSAAPVTVIGTSVGRVWVIGEG